MHRCVVCGAFPETAAEETPLNKHAPSTFEPPQFPERCVRVCTQTPVFCVDGFETNRIERGPRHNRAGADPGTGPYNPMHQVQFGVVDVRRSSWCRSAARA